MKKKILLAKIPEELKKLRKKCEVVKSVDKDIKQLVADMFDSMQADNGIGLSAPQVGVLKRVVIGEYKRDHANSSARQQPKQLNGQAVKAGLKNHVPRTVLINPKITWVSKKQVVDEEGCLSFPNLYGMVRRPERIRYKGLDENGNVVEGKALDLHARIIQHEIDHLNGVLFIDKLEGDLYTYEKQSDTEKL